MKKNNLSAGYDDVNDVLYIGLKDMANSYGDEDVDNFVVFRDFDTEELTGYQIMGFKRHIEEVFDFKFEGFSLERLFKLLIEKEGCEWLKDYLDRTHK